MYKVLLVDDEPLILRGLEHLINWKLLDLEIAGSCLDGAEALSFLTLNKVDILITDIKMPVMNGLDLIKNIKAKNPHTRYIVLSGYDDFNLAKEAIVLGIENYILKPVSVDEMTATLINTLDNIKSELHKNLEYNASRSTLKNNILNRWISGNINEDEFLERSPMVGLEITGYEILSVIVEISDNLEKPLFQSAVLDIFNSALGEKFKVHCFCNYTGNVVILFQSDEGSSSIGFIKEAIEFCIHAVKESLGIQVIVYIGSWEKQFSGANVSYENAQSLKDYLLVYPTQNLLIYDEMKETAGQYKKSIVPDVNVVQQILTAGRKETVLPFVDHFYDQIKASGVTDPNDIRDATIELLITIRSVMKKLSTDSEQLNQEFKIMFKKAFLIKSLDKLKEWIGSIFILSIDFLNQKNSATSPIIRKALDFIDNNYYKDLDMRSVAEKLKISPVYLGYLFKKETGNVFSHYLSQVRIEAAKKLLSNPKNKIADIAQQVGYLNTNYFFTVFRRYEGISPAEYRQG